MCLVTSLVHSGGKGDCFTGVNLVIMCDTGICEELLIVEGLPAWRW